MEVHFNRDKLIERLLSDVIMLRFNIIVLEKSIELLLKDKNPNYNHDVFLKSIRSSVYQQILSSYPEIDEAFLKKLRDELGL